MEQTAILFTSRSTVRTEFGKEEMSISETIDRKQSKMERNLKYGTRARCLHYQRPATPQGGLGLGKRQSWAPNGQVVMTSRHWKSGMETKDLSGREVGGWEHSASKLKGFEGVHEISKRQKPGRRSPVYTGATSAPAMWEKKEELVSWTEVCW